MGVVCLLIDVLFNTANISLSTLHSQLSGSTTPSVLATAATVLLTSAGVSLLSDAAFDVSVCVFCSATCPSGVVGVLDVFSFVASSGFTSGLTGSGGS